MKKIFFSAILMLALVSCKERDSLINFIPDRPGEKLELDSVYAVNPVPQAQPLRVLIEDLTGVRCLNCPDAQKVAENISDAHPGMISIVAEHVTSLAKPLPKSKYDFRTPDANHILSLFTKDPNALPAGVINRNKYLNGSDTTFYTTYQSWVGHVEAELKNSAPVNIDFQNFKFDGATSILSGTIAVTFTSDVTAPTGITVMLTESGMIDIQDISVSPGIDTAYVFQHTLRKVMQPWQGLQLSTTATKGQVYSVKFSTQISNEWIPQNMSAIAFVHRMSGNDIKILQVQEKDIK